MAAVRKGKKHNWLETNLWSWAEKGSVVNRCTVFTVLTKILRVSWSLAEEKDTLRSPLEKLNLVSVWSSIAEDQSAVTWPHPFRRLLLGPGLWGGAMVNGVMAHGDRDGTPQEASGIRKQAHRVYV